MIVADELEAIESLWETGLETAFAAYQAATASLGEADAPRVALAAALVETALGLQRLGRPAPPAPDLLRGDLCLARASRLLADTRDRRLQVSFARAIEEQSAAAAAERELEPTRSRLLRAIDEASAEAR
ncbi:MAG TPA: hypothetical protein VIO86_11625 [Candidatus Dormibacteraeota bacterium]